MKHTAYVAWFWRQGPPVLRERRNHARFGLFVGACLHVAASPARVAKVIPLLRSSECLCLRAFSLSGRISLVWEMAFPASDTLYLALDVTYLETDALYLEADVLFLGPDASCLTVDALYLRPDVMYLAADAPYLEPDVTYLVADATFPEVKKVLPKVKKL
ncbi:MAG: hypothetical protein WAU71_09695 [Pyrinomonadaceae bacterium]